jgi:hypothetical protein
MGGMPVGGRGGTGGMGGMPVGGRGGTGGMGGRGGAGGTGGVPTGGRGGNPDVQCVSNSDCMQWPDGVGDCCGYCLPRSAPMPPTIACIRACDMPTDCPCIQGRCTAVPRGGTTASH